MPTYTPRREPWVIPSGPPPRTRCFNLPPIHHAVLVGSRSKRSRGRQNRSVLRENTSPAYGGCFGGCGPYLHLAENGSPVVGDHHLPVARLDHLVHAPRSEARTDGIGDRLRRHDVGDAYVLSPIQAEVRRYTRLRGAATSKPLRVGHRPTPANTSHSPPGEVPRASHQGTSRTFEILYLDQLTTGAQLISPSVSRASARRCHLPKPRGWHVSPRYSRPARSEKQARLRLTRLRIEARLSAEAARGPVMSHQGAFCFPP